MSTSRPSHRQGDGIQSSQRTPHTWGNMGSSAAAAQRLRNEESWVEISSQPSSSSLSSIDNEVVTTGLRVASSNLRRGRRHGPTSASRSPQVVAQPSTSSQDEYDESESSSDDRILSSSNENIRSGRISPRQQMRQDIHFPPPSEDEDDEDEDRTALGVAPPAFTPQPNAFSHPPNQVQTSQRDPYFPPRHYRASHPSHRAANDAALRASLTTLLSCAKAARLLPKQPSSTMHASGANRNEYHGMRLVPESELLATPPPSTSPNFVPELALASPSTRPRSSATVSEDENERRKRKPTQQGRSAKKKKVLMEGRREQTKQLLSPTLVTWLVSAGVVIVVSVVGFGAGYAMGYETGKQEGEILKNCGSDIRVPRVKRFRWGGGSGIAA